MRRERVSRWLQRLEVAFFALSVVCAAWYAYVRADAAWIQSRQRTTFERLIAGRALPGEDEWVLATPVNAPATGVIGELEIPRIGLSATVMAGDDEGTLRVAVGYLPDTPPPWEAGNSALAGHRDTFFRPLQRIRTGDDIRILTSRGAFQYRVRQTLVVDPEDVWVLDSMPRVNLTLITCFPVSFVGHAPQRFVVQAEKLQAAARAEGWLRRGK